VIVTLLVAALLFLAAQAQGGTYVLTTTADSGPGSLRQAILDANSGACSAPCQIHFDVPSGVMTVEPLTQLPDITASGVSLSPQLPYQGWRLEISGKNLTVGSGLHFRGSNSTVAGVVINRFPGSGVVIEGGANVHVASCVIGLDATGRRPAPNGQNGVTIVRGHDNVVDSTTIGGNGQNGIYAIGTTNLFLGLDIIGKQGLPQGSGDIALGNGASGVVMVDVNRAILLGNIIVNNSLDGVVIAGNSTGIKVESRDLPTVIYGNGLLSIDIGFDGVTEPRPVIETAEVNNGFVRVVGHVQAAPNASVEVGIFFSNAQAAFGTAEAKSALTSGKVTSDASGVARFDIRASESTNIGTIDVVGEWISASATTDAGTLELSAPVQAVLNNQNFAVVTGENLGAGSLRQAILDANAGPCAADYPCRIVFNAQTISPTAPLPPITRSGIIVDGQNTITLDGSRSSPGAGITIAGQGATTLLAVAVTRMTITGFRGDGIVIDGTGGEILNPVISNSVIAGNSGAGIRVKGNVPFVHFGTFGSGNRMVANTIRDNGSHGVDLESGFFELDGNTIRANAGSGVFIEKPAGAHLENNKISHNGQAGVTTVPNIPTTFKAAIQNSIHSNVGEAIELRSAPAPQQTPPEITSATYDATSGIGTITGFFTRVASSTPNGWTTVLDFATSTFPETGGRGSLETPIYVNYNVKDEGNGRFSFTGMTSFQDLRGKRISATASPFIFEGFKGPPEENVFGQGFVYGTTSQPSKAVPVVTAGCGSALPMLRAVNVSGANATLVWSDVAGATGYNVWLRSVPGTPRIVASSIGPTAAITVPAGVYEVFVEATFSGCPPMKSEASTIEVAPGRHRPAGR
jgi:hypothetical protein